VSDNSATEEAMLALVAVLEARDEFTKECSMRVSFIASRLAEIYKLDDELQEHIKRAAMLHNIGMISVPDSVLLKPGRLSDDERAMINQTPSVSVKILKSIKSLELERSMILHTNEYWDGSGYPDGLIGEEIPLGSRFISIAKAIDAMTTNRAYRRARPVSYCLEQLDACAGSQFDPTLAGVAITALCKGLATKSK